METLSSPVLSTLSLILSKLLDNNLFTVYLKHDEIPVYVTLHELDIILKFNELIALKHTALTLTITTVVQPLRLLSLAIGIL